MKITKNILLCAAQGYKNVNNGKYGKVDFSIYRKIINFKFGIDEGYAGIIGNSIHVNIQGSDEPREHFDIKLGNFNFILQKLSDDHYGKNKNIMVHPGFKNSYDSGREKLLKLVNGYEKIFIECHSRSGGIGVPFARDVKWHIDNVWKYDAEVIFLGGGIPRYYNEEGANEFNSCGITAINMRYKNDLIWNLPFEWQGYRHIGFILNLGEPFIKIPVGNPFDHYPQKYFDGVNLLPEEIF